MSPSTDTIEHPGTVIEVKDDLVRVEIDQLSACGHCSTKQSCCSSDKPKMIVEIQDIGRETKKGDHVFIILQKQKGILAVVFSYIIPFILVFLTLIITNTFTKNEMICGLLSLGSLIPYYTVLWLLQNRIKTAFSFRLRS
jgi:sigma-E factor negative regulatory protein RseC